MSQHQYRNDDGLWLALLLATFLLLCLWVVGHAAPAPQYFCVGPPVPCAMLTALDSWTFAGEAAAPHEIRVQANGRDYGRAARGTQYSYPNSIIVRDTIFGAGGFE